MVAGKEKECAPPVEVSQSDALRHQQSPEAEEATTEPEEEDIDIINILYIFCGVTRKGDIAECLQRISKNVILKDSQGIELSGSHQNLREIVILER